MKYRKKSEWFLHFYLLELCVDLPLGKFSAVVYESPLADLENFLVSCPSIQHRVKNHNAPPFVLACLLLFRRAEVNSFTSCRSRVIQTTTLISDGTSSTGPHQVW